MVLEVSETYEKTWDAYYDLLTDEEFAEEVKKWNKLKLNGVPSKYRYTQIVSMGGSRSSKSYSILQLLLTEMMNNYNLKIVVWRNLKNICRSSVMEDFKNIIMFDHQVYKDIKENKQKGEFTYLPTGSRIIFEGADDIGKVLGGTQDISFFNEVTEFSYYVYLQIKQRTALRTICDYNPSKNFWLENSRLDDRTIFIHSNFYDNAFCPPNIVTHLLSYEPWESGSYVFEDRKLSYKGAPISPQNLPPPHEENVRKRTADTYMWLVYGLGMLAEKPNKIYRGWIEIDEEYFDNLEYPSYFGLDFGAINPTACIEVKYDGDDAFYIKEALYTPLSEIDDSLPTLMKLKVPQLRTQDLMVCDSAKQKYIDLLINEGYNAVAATKGGGSVEVGVTLVQGFTIYFVASHNLNKEYDNYSWMIDRYEKSTDVPIKDLDHLMDALRYIISYLVEYLGIKV